MDTLTHKASSFKWLDNKTLELSYNSKEMRDEVLFTSANQTGIASINPVYIVEDRLVSCHV